MSAWNIRQLTGRILKLDLKEGTVDEIELEDETYRRFLGGRGLNQFLLAKNVEPATLPLASESMIAFGAGPLVGTSAPGAVRLSVDAKNLFSGGVGSANAGGDFARALKLAGIGNILVTGKAERPVYIAIERGKVTIRDGTKLWGKTTSETDDALRGLLGQTARVLCIGPAGEKLVRGACVVIDKARVAAKCGVGTVMASKQLKAIAVLGDNPVVVSNPEAFEAKTQVLWRKVLSSAIAERINLHGSFYSSAKNKIGAVPIRHYSDGYMNPKRYNRLNAQAFKKYETLRFTTHGCPLECRAKYTIKSGHYRGTNGEAMEANTIQNFGYKLDIVHPPAIIHAHILCNEYGMDMDTVAESIAWAFECYDKGILTSRDADGLKLSWGNHRALATLIDRIANRHGFGDILAEGSQQAAQILGRGSSEFVLAMKGQDLYETMRMPKGWGLGVALATRGGGHCSGSPLTEFFPETIDSEISERMYGIRTAGSPTAYEGKAELVSQYERFHAVLNSLGICYFMTMWESPDLLNWADLADLVSIAFGWEMSEDDLMAVGERIHTLERVVNWTCAGLDRKHDYPPKRFFTEAIKSGPCAGEILDRDEFDNMLSRNYALHGWNESGLPTVKVLHQLGLEDICTGF